MNLGNLGISAMGQNFKIAITGLKQKSHIYNFGFLSISNQIFEKYHRKLGAGEGRCTFGPCRENQIFAVFEVKKFAISNFFSFFNRY